MRVVWLALVVAWCGVCYAAVAAPPQLPIDPVVWSTSDTLNAHNADGIFFYAMNQSIGKRSPATGDVVWYSTELNTFVFQFTMAATSGTVALYDNTALLGPYWWSVRAADGTVVANRSVAFDCSNALLAVGDTWFVCVSGNNSIGVVDATGTMMWSSLESGLFLAPQPQQSAAPSFVNVASMSTNGEQVLFFTASSPLGTPVLVVLDPKDWSMLVLPNVTAVAPLALNGILFCLLADGAVGAIDATTLSWQWQTAPSEPLSSLSILDPQLLVVGSVGILVGCPRMTVVCSLFSYDLSGGGLIANTTFGAAQPLQSVAPAEGLLVVSYYNETGVVTCRTFDPVASAWVAYGALPGGTFDVVPSSATCGTSLFAPNPQGYAHVSARTLDALSYNLDLPYSSIGQMVFPNTPSVSKTTVVMLYAFANATAVVLSC